MRCSVRSASGLNSSTGILLINGSIERVAARLPGHLTRGE